MPRPHGLPGCHPPTATTAVQAQPSDSCHALRCLRCSFTCLPCPSDHHPHAAYAHLAGRPPHCSQSHRAQPLRHQHRARPLPLLPPSRTATRSACRTPPTPHGRGGAAEAKAASQSAPHASSLVGVADCRALPSAATTRTDGRASPCCTNHHRWSREGERGWGGGARPMGLPGCPRPESLCHLTQPPHRRRKAAGHGCRSAARAHRFWIRPPRLQIRSLPCAYRPDLTTKHRPSRHPRRP
jgi:hypothetical protein